MRLGVLLIKLCFPQVYKKAGKELCTAIDVALAKGGCEAVVESFYSVMGTQRKGNVSNEVLELRAMVDWSFPHPYRCQASTEDVADIYANGNERLHLPSHSKLVHNDNRLR